MWAGSSHLSHQFRLINAMGMGDRPTSGGQVEASSLIQETPAGQHQQQQRHQQRRQQQSAATEYLRPPRLKRVCAVHLGRVFVGRARWAQSKANRGQIRSTSPGHHQTLPPFRRGALTPCPVRGLMLVHVAAWQATDRPLSLSLSLCPALPSSPTSLVQRVQSSVSSSSLVCHLSTPNDVLPLGCLSHRRTHTRSHFREPGVRSPSVSRRPVHVPLPYSARIRPVGMPEYYYCLPYIAIPRVRRQGESRQAGHGLTAPSSSRFLALTARSSMHTLYRPGLAIFLVSTSYLSLSGTQSEAFPLHISLHRGGKSPVRSLPIMIMGCRRRPRTTRYGLRRLPLSTCLMRLI